MTLDYLEPLSRSGKKKYILVATDNTKRLAIVKATDRADAQTTAKFILVDMLIHYSMPAEVQTDRGPQLYKDMVIVRLHTDGKVNR